MNGLSQTRLRTKLILTYVAFVVPILAVSGFFYYESARRRLDAELGERLVAVAQATATRFNPMIVSSFERGDEQGRTYQSYRASLVQIRDRTNLKRLFVFDPQLRSLLDTQDGITIGTGYARLRFQEAEIKACLEGRPAASVLFQGEDGAWYKSGFAAIVDRQGKAVAIVGTDASATYLSHIAGLRRSILAFVLLGAGLTVGLGFLLARSVTRPVNRLVSQAERIGRGKMDQPLKIGEAGTREIAFLARALDRMRERLSQREENQRMMVAGVAHEIRNPLGGIELFASLASQELKKDSEASKYLERVIEEVGSLKAILNNFLEFARPAPPKPDNLELSPLIQTAAGLVTGQTRTKAAEISIDIPREALHVRADPEQLSRVFLNLFNNALEALPDSNGKITVTASRKDSGEIAVELRDNGCGMDSETVKKIFNPFFTTRDSGLGLGLAIVKKTLEENGGWIEVDSAPGKGTCFTLLLPGSTK
jgi:signal transduction histidine kinase